MIGCKKCVEEDWKCTVCKAGYTEGDVRNKNHPRCPKCEIKCNTCLDTIDNCKDCSGANRDKTKNCDCIDTYYDDAGVCTKCPVGCKKC